MSLARTLLLRASRSPWLADQATRRTLSRRAVRRFMPGERLEDALHAARDLATSGLGTLLTRLGENVTEPAEATAVCDHYLDVLDAIRDRTLPSEVSIKLTQLGLDFDATSCEAHVRDIAERAAAVGSVLWIDMEDSSYVDATLGLYRRLLPEFPALGIAIQAYLHRTPADVAALLPLRPTIRLVKGAYREPAEVALPHKRDVDQQYFDVGVSMLKATRDGGGIRVVFGTHDLALVDRLRAKGRDLGLTADAFEVHMLYGIRSEAQRQLAGEGVPIKTLISYGEAWFPWYMRRLAERPANVWFVLRSLLP